jgi:prepilin-type N-terminal cleavage/methylation domain-containing protein
MPLKDQRLADAVCPRTSILRKGFSLIELLIVIAVIMIMAAASFPMVQSTISYMRLRAAAASVSGTIQSTRYQAISSGFPYRVAFDSASGKFQVASDPTASGTFGNVGSLVPFAGSGANVVLGASTTLQFSPSGKVTFTAGASPMVLTYSGRTATITVSNYGNVNVKYTP